MKLKNKNTGKVYDFEIKADRGSSGDLILIADMVQYEYKTIELMNKDWENYTEPKDDYTRVIESFIHYVEEADDSFCCDETVQKFAEKLKAWERLKDKGFKFTGWEELGCDYKNDMVGIEIHGELPVSNAISELDILFREED